MDAVLRAAAVYFVILLLFRIAGRRSLDSMTAFDLALLLIISEATQHALLGDDFSVTNAFIVIGTLILMDIGLSVVKARWPNSAKVLDGLPIVLVEDGKPLKERMKRARIDESDILEYARQARGLERLDQIKFAVLEVGGGVSIIPKDEVPRR